ncbi:MAG: hypothetical protein AB8B82_02730 [Roseovarius sp.]
MKLNWILAFSAVLAFAGCDYTRTIKGTFTVDGQSFPYERTNREKIGLDDDESDRYRYLVTLPDGTKQSTYTFESRYNAVIQREKIAKDWLERQAKEPGISDTIAGPPKDPANLPKPEDSKGD